MRWIILSLSWDLGNVRAVLTLLINALCSIGIWIIAYASWKSRALKAVKTPRVDLLSLLSVSGFGDVVDALSVLDLRYGLYRFYPILMQCITILILSSAAILSGPIA